MIESFSLKLNQFSSSVKESVKQSVKASAKKLSALTNVEDPEYEEESKLPLDDEERGVQTGQLVNTDGSTYRMPTLTTSYVKREDYVPSDYVQKKLEKAKDELNATKTAYESRIGEVETHYKTTLSEKEKYYLDEIYKMKGNAVKHIQLEKNLKEEIREKLTAELKTRQITIDDLNDRILDLNQTIDEQNLTMRILNNDLSKKEVELCVEEMCFILEYGNVYSKEQEQEGLLRDEMIHELQMKEELEAHIKDLEEKLYVNQVELENIHKVNDEYLIQKLEEAEEEHKKHQDDYGTQLKETFATEIEKQAEELARIKTKLVADTFRYGTNLTRLEREKEELLGRLNISAVKVCLDDLINQVCTRVGEVVVMEEKPKHRRVRHHESKAGAPDAAADAKDAASPVQEPKHKGRKVAHHHSDDAKASSYPDNATEWNVDEEKRHQIELHIDLQQQDEDVTEQTIGDIMARVNRELVEASAAYKESVAQLTFLKKERSRVKGSVKKWLSDFQAENGRAATMQERLSVQSLFEEFKTKTLAYEKGEEDKDIMLKNKIAAEGRVAMLRDQMEQLGVSREEYEGVAAGSVSASKILSQSSKKVMQKMASSKAAAAEAGEDGLTTTSIHEHEDLDAEVAQRAKEKMVSNETVEGLEDEIYNLKAELKRVGELKKKSEDDQAHVKKQLEEMTKEKRTDILERLTNEVEQLRGSNNKNLEIAAAATAQKAKDDLKLVEMKDALAAVEAELKIRNQLDTEDLSTAEKEKQLTEELSKQVSQVKLKSKAATAGWNANAKTQEEMEIEVQKAYDKGLAEGKSTAKSDYTAINGAIEDKDKRITELMVEIQQGEDKVRQAEKQAEEFKEKAKDAEQEALDTIATFGQAAADGNASAAASTEELDKTKDELEAAQDEIASLADRLEEMEKAAETANQTISVLEQLRQVDDSHAAANNRSKSRKGGSEPKRNYLPDIISACRGAVVKGSSLWKHGKKDECCDLYMHVVEDAIGKLQSEGLRKPLEEALAAAQKEREKKQSAMKLRRGIDKIVNDGKLPDFKKAEEAACAGGAATVQKSAAKSPVVVELESELQNLKDALDRAEEEKADAIRRAKEEFNAAKAEMDGSRKNIPTEGDGSEVGAGASPSSKKGPPAMLSKSSKGGSKMASKLLDADGGDDDEAMGGLDMGTGSTSLLKRAKHAESQVKTLKKQLAKLTQGGVPLARSDSTKMTEAEKKAASAENAVQVRRLQRRIKLLEQQLENGGGGGGRGGGVADKKALIQAEKTAAKKYRDLETTTKKQIKTLEKDLEKTKKAFDKMSAEFGPIKEERDTLKQKAKDNMKQSVELEKLRNELKEVPELKESNAYLTKELDTTLASLKKETLLRKKYKNEIEDLKGAIRVFARCRPMAKYEIEKGCQKVVNFTAEDSMTIESDRGLKEFTFDQVFTAESEQGKVFEDTKLLIESCLDGYNVCLFAYGQTGSGKTFTMTGNATLPGLTPRAIDEIFRLIDERKHCKISVSTYFVELYLDALVDLYWILDNKHEMDKRDGPKPPDLAIKMDAKKMVFIQNCIIKEAHTPEDLMDLFNRGNLERHVGATKMNAESSRSHSIFAILIESFDPSTKRTTTGKLSLVDLAGSERADKTGATKDRLKEGMAINKSLSALGDVIASLSSGEKFIPYRNSKLTQMMQDSLGGNAKTLMFVNFSPADYNADETVTSLKYAERVKKITNDASKAAESGEVTRLKRIIKKLKAGQSAEEDESGDEEGEKEAS